MSYKKFCFGKKIYDVTLHKNNIPAVNDIVLHLVEEENDVIILRAEADCCSSSWFHFFENDDIKKIIGRKIKSIRIVGPIDLPPSGIQERDLNDIIEIAFTDDTIYNFVLRNSSNGYYTGWLSIEMNWTLNPHH